VRTSAIVKREPPSGARSSTSPPILDVELTVVLPTNPAQVTLVPHQVTVSGGVLVRETLPPADRTKSVVLVRPAQPVGREGSLMAMFGVECPGAKGTLRVDMTFVSPMHEGDSVSAQRVNSY
jgi:hypothetical protein